MESDWIVWLKVISPIVMLLISGAVALAAYFGKRMIDGFAHELYKVRRRQDDSERDFLKFQAQLPRVYVLKDDHIRHITIVEKKIDDHALETQRRLAAINGDIKLILREMPKRRTDAET